MEDHRNTSGRPALDTLIDSILADALAATGGVGCLPGCTRPVEDGDVHRCSVVVGALRGGGGQEIEVVVVRNCVNGHVCAPQVELRSFVYVVPARGRRREQFSTAPQPAPYQRRPCHHIVLPVDQAFALVPLLAAAATEAGAGR